MKSRIKKSEVQWIDVDELTVRLNRFIMEHNIPDSHWKEINDLITTIHACQLQTMQGEFHNFLKDNYPYLLPSFEVIEEEVRL